jgi:orotidine-5'-phosphate decarboxylase
MGGLMPTTPIVALDVPTMTDAMTLVDRLGERCAFYKIGSELFTAEGPRVVREIVGRDRAVFLDLKYHDIPNTVAHAVRRAAALGVKLLTVHASGGETMTRAAVAAAADASSGACGILAVTVLTSLNDADLARAWGRDDRLNPLDEVLRLAALAASAAAHGIVCSGLELRAVRERFGDSLATLVPGVRLSSDAAHDQARVITPAAAAALGARYVVIGRTVTAAPDPAIAMDRVLRDLESGAANPS